MGTHVTPYLHFTDTAREAMEFYRDVLGGELSLMTFGDLGSESTPDRVMHAQLDTPGGITLMASDAPEGTSHTKGTTVSVALSGDDAATLRGWWEQLSAGGTVHVPLERQMWGDEFGTCDDRFGVTWLVNIAGSAG